MYKFIRSVSRPAVSLLTACALAVSALSPGSAAFLTAGAAGGSCGTNAKWDLNNGTLTISGSGAVTSTPWSGSKSQIRTAVVENGITSLPSSSFNGYSALTSLKMPDTVTSIGSFLCYECKALTTVQFSDSIEVIPSEAFYSCQSLETVNLPSALTTVKSNAFSGCLALTELTLPRNVVTVEQNAFFANNVKKLTLNDGLTTIGAGAFAMSCFAGVTVPDSVKTIGKGAFDICYDRVYFEKSNCTGYVKTAKKVVITGSKGSAAETYAKTYQHTFVATGAEDVHTHTWSDWKTESAADCEAAGKEYRVCAGCGEKQYREISATGHNWGDWKVVKAATEEAEGLEERICTYCGKKETRSIEKLTPHVHSWGDWKTTKEETCTKDGLKVRTCTDCGEKQEQVIPATGHDWSEWAVDTAAGCETAGKEYRMCGNCAEKEYREIPATGHNWGDWKVVKAATEDAEGLEERICAYCGKKETRSIEKLTPHVHNWGAWKTVTEETCTEDGLKARTCADCGEKQEQVIPATGHQWTDWNVEKAAGCETTGLESRMCVNCAEKESRYLPATGHNWGEWRVVTAPTEEKEGTEERICMNCGKKETRSVEKLTPHVHSWGAWETVKAETCTENGQKVRICVECGEKQEKVIPATGHGWSEWKVETAAGCETAGTEARMCATCGEKETREIPPIGHSWGEWKLTKEPTLTEEGERRRVCANCGEVQTEPVAKTTGYAVTVTAGTGGTVTPAGETLVAEGGSFTVQIAADKGYQIASVILDGTAQPVQPSLTLNDIRSAHTIAVAFVQEKHSEPVCVGITAAAKRPYFMTSEQAFSMADFDVKALISEDGKVTEKNITKDCAPLSVPALYEDQETYGETTLSLRYRGDDKTISAYAAGAPLMVSVTMVLLGDGNFSGTIDGADATMTLIANNNMMLDDDYGLTPAEFAALDVDKNGVIEPKDGLYILRYFNFSMMEDVVSWEGVLA